MTRVPNLSPLVCPGFGWILKLTLKRLYYQAQCKYNIVRLLTLSMESWANMIRYRQMFVTICCVSSIVLYHIFLHLHIAILQSWRNGSFINAMNDTKILMEKCDTIVHHLMVEGAVMPLYIILWWMAPSTLPISSVTLNKVWSTDSQ